MKTLIKDDELDAELQELYLTGKQWLYDLDFLESEERFLYEQLANNCSEAGKHLTSRLEEASLLRVRLAENISGFMNKLEPLIVEPDRVLHLQQIEDFAGLQSGVQNALAVLKGIKYALLEEKRAA